MQQSLHAGTQIDEGAKLAHRGDAAREHCADDDRATDVGGAGPLLLLEQSASRDDDVPAAFLVFDDPERVDASFVLGRIVSRDVMSICDIGQKARWRAMRTSYPPFTAFSTFPSTGRPAWKASSSWRSVAAPRASFRERCSPPAVETTTAWMRSPTATSSTPSSSFSSATSIVGLALPADVDQRHFRPDRDDRPLDGLTLRDALHLERRFEHRAKVFFGFAHGTSTVTCRAAARLQEAITAVRTSPP